MGLSYLSRVFLLFVCPLFLYNNSLSQDRKGVLVLDLDSTQFYCDVINVEELEKVMGVTLPKMAGYLNSWINSSINLQHHEGYYFYFPSTVIRDSIRVHMGYRTMGGVDRPAYLGTIPLDPSQSMLRGVLNSTRTGFFLSVNLYEILASDTYEKPGDDLLHVIHYELFNDSFELISSGRYQGISPEIIPENMEWFYKDFGMDMLFWAEASEMEGEPEDNFANISESYIKEKLGTTNKESVGVVLGLGMPYGGIGLEYANMKGEKFDWNLGIGWDFSGLKLGTGVRFYPLGFDRRQKPFIGLNYSFTSGRKMIFGREYDEFGNVINPQDVSTYKIPLDNSLHLQVGLLYFMFGDFGISPQIGYAFPFKRDLPELLSGPQVEANDQFVRFISPGGISFGVIFQGFF